MAELNVSGQRSPVRDARCLMLCNPLDELGWMPNPALQHSPIYVDPSYPRFAQ